ncbi:MAG: hypothetical protein Q4A43_03315 [Coriobacteriia bacterium]|nr:hypothetical protein [Coriobacteriia bacterium]
MEDILRTIGKYAFGGIGAFIVLGISNLIATGSIAWEINVGFALIIASAWAISDGFRQSLQAKRNLRNKR